MANPTKLTVTSLALDGSVARPTEDVIDTNGTVPIAAADLAGRTGDLILEVVEQNVATLTVKVLAGDNPPSVRSSLGDLSVTIAKNAAKIIGPFESARFMQDDGTVQVSFSEATAASAKVRTYLLPRA